MEYKRAERLPDEEKTKVEDVKGCKNKHVAFNNVGLYGEFGDLVLKHGELKENIHETKKAIYGTWELVLDGCEYTITRWAPKSLLIIEGVTEWTK